MSAGVDGWWRHAMRAADVPASAVASGSLTVRDVSSRNGGALLDWEGAPGIVVKTGPGVEHEARTIRALAAAVRDPGVLPEIIGPGADPDTLVLAAAPGAENLWQLHHRIGRFPRSIGASIGVALAVVHGAPPPPGLPEGPPDVLAIHRPGVRALREMSPALGHLTRALQGDAVLTGGLDAIIDGWRGNDPLHGDVRWSNLVPRRGGVRLVDWEDARVGDAAWDVGCALAAYVGFWIDSIGIPRHGPPPSASALAASALHPVSAMRPAMAAMWDTYLARLPVPPGAAGALRERVAVCCAAALVRAAFDDAAERDVLPARAVLHLQVASNLMADPAAAAASLLGS